MRELMYLRIKIQGEKVDMLWCADNIVVLAESKGDLQNILTIMNIIFKDEYNKKINKYKKTYNRSL